MNFQTLLPEDARLGEGYTSEVIQDWLVHQLAKLLAIEPEEVDVDITFDRYGLDSSAAIGLTGELSDWMGIDIEPTLLYDYPTVESLVQYLAESVTEGKQAA